MLTASFEQIDQAPIVQSKRNTDKSTSFQSEKGLPENYDYTDTGCEIAPSCLECPLALCKYDDPNGVARSNKVMRDQEIVRLHGQGLGVSEIAQVINISERTVYRIIQRDVPREIRHSRRRRRSGIVASVHDFGNDGQRWVAGRQIRTREVSVV